MCECWSGVESAHDRIDRLEYRMGEDIGYLQEQLDDAVAVLSFLVKGHLVTYTEGGVTYTGHADSFRGGKVILRPNPHPGPLKEVPLNQLIGIH